MDYDSLCTYLESKPGARRDMPFGSEVLVFKVQHKMFALVAWQEDPLKISLKTDPIEALLNRQRYTAVKPGYHLHKQHWNTVTLDGSIPNEALRQMIDDSYTLVVQGMTRADRAQLKNEGWQSDGS